MSRTLQTGLALMAVTTMVLFVPHVAQAYQGQSTVTPTADVVDVLKSYVDPGAAGFIIVSVLGFISAIGYMARTYIGRLKRLFCGKRRRAEHEQLER